MPTLSLAERLRGLRVLVGNTPLLAIDYALDGGAPRRLFAKAENLNLTGSIKDRMALHILRRAIESGELAPDGLVIEATSGNTGIAFAAVGRALGHPVTIFMPDWMSAERIALIRSLGATIRLVSPAEGGFLGSIRLAEELAAATPGAFLPRQFANELNSDAHFRTTGPEIWSQLQHEQLVPDAFVAGVGTGGTIMGAGRYLRSMRPSVRLHPVEPANSPTLSTGHKVGRHRIQGISDEFIPPIVQLDELDRVLAVDDGDAILMAQSLAAGMGLGVGISSGANFLAAVQAQEELGPDAVVATVFSDSNKKYLSTDLLNEEPEKPGHLSPRVRLLGFRAINRVCDVCFDPADPASAPAGLFSIGRRDDGRGNLATARRTPAGREGSAEA
jgi:cysteine synthase A